MRYSQHYAIKTQVVKWLSQRRINSCGLSRRSLIETNSYYPACRINTVPVTFQLPFAVRIRPHLTPVNPNVSQPFSIALLWFVLGPDNFLGRLRVLLFLLNKVGLIEQGSE